MIKGFSGTTHQVMTAVWVTIVKEGKVWKQETFTEVTQVSFADLCDAQIKAYVESKEPYGKAGGYGI